MTRRELEDERRFLLRSLEDLDREYRAGDLSDDDLAALRDGYVARTAAVIRALEDPPEPTTATAPAPAPPPAATGDGDEAPIRSSAAEVRPVVGRGGRAGRRRVLVVVTSVVVGAAVVAAVATAVAPRLTGETLTGSVTLTPAEQAARSLGQAETDESRGDAADAVKLYQSVLRQDPDQEQALAELGWLEYEAGAQARQGALLSVGQGEEQRAEQVAPGDFAPHLYLGSMFLAQGDATGAVGEYRSFLADHPPKAKVRAAVPFIVKAFADTHQTPPPLPVGS